MRLHALRQCAQGIIPPNVALMQLWIEAGSETAARCALENAIEITKEQAESGPAERLLAMRRLWAGAPDAYSKVFAIHQLANRGVDGPPDSRIRQFAALFDFAAAVSSAAGVALYSLGETNLLDETTREVVARMREWELLNGRSRVLDLGCGSGRFLEALAPHVLSIIGIDVSKAMLEAALARIAPFENAKAIEGSGCDLAAAGPGPFDLVLAVDSFPYLVQAGVAERHIAECARLLRSDGYLLILNYSYAGDVENHREELSRLAGPYGFRVLRNGTQDFMLWDGTAFLLQVCG